MSSITIVILQDLNFLRKRVNQKSQQEVNTVSMQQFNMNSNTLTGFKHVLTSIDDPILNPASNEKPILGEEEKEDVYFDVSQFDKNGAKATAPANANNLFTTPGKMHEIHIRVRDGERPSALKKFIDNNQTLLVICFVALLFLNFAASALILIRSVSYSHYIVSTILFYPGLIAVCYIFEKYI